MKFLLPLILFLLLVFIDLRLYAGNMDNGKKDPPFLSDEKNTWVDSILNTMTLDEKIGQLLMVAAYSNKDEAHYQEIENYIQKYKIGGLIFFQGTPEKQAELTNRFQALSSNKLLIGFDGEWGLSMRLKNTINYPHQLMLGAIENENIIYEMGAEFARQMKRIGIHINFAPVVDVNNNPKNPVINDRSFGDNKYNVTLKAKAYMAGLQDNHILACAKHFPGHGDTDVDSHYDLPVLQHSKDRLEKIELYPFRALIRNGIGSIMVAHMNVLALDKTPNLPSTLSPKVVQEKLIDDMGFKGLIFTDAMNMKGITKLYPSGVAEVKAIQAGIDVMLFSENVDKAIQGIKAAVEKGEITEKRIDISVRKILLTKYWAGLNNYQPVKLEGIAEDINNEQAKLILTEIVENAITVVEDKNTLIPIIDVREKIAHVAIGNGNSNVFSKRMDDYCKIDHFYLSKNETKTTYNQLIGRLKKYDKVILEINDMSRFASRNYGLTEAQIEAIKNINQTKKTINIIFGSPYSLGKIGGFSSIMLAYNEDSATQDITAQILFGARAATGTLPVSAGIYEYGTGLCTNGNLRLGYGLPIEAGMNAETLKQIDIIANEAIKSGATPSAQILVAKDGKVVYQKSFGTFTYNNTAEVSNENLYDIASITKVAATVPVIMRMYEDKKIDLNKTLGDYYSYPIGCNKALLNIKSVLMHESGLAAWIPFYKNTLDANQMMSAEWYSKTCSPTFSVKVVDSAYLCYNFIDSVRNMIYNSELGDKKYKYSDLGFYLLKEIIEKTYADSFQNVVQKYVWSYLGMNHTTYNPLDHHFSLSDIVPTEDEKGFRNRLIQGTVHDPGAALLGGIAGHAGVFSNANDLAKYFQMLLNGGTYGGTIFYHKSTVNLFTSKQSSANRRAIGFDRPTANGESGPTCGSASASSFGHTGFTGTIAWADPQYNLIYILLSNRINPSASNQKFINQNIRPRIQQVIYNSIRGK
jgi:beta-glucosidase-like glycosyl hydrolase/CubicO group peptidase (beta-lactamase class C family)